MTRVLSSTDYHTGGEPFRIVTAGAPVPEGETVAQRRRWAVEHLDDERAMLCREPRGHADMYGCFLTPPDDAQGHLGTVFFHNDGFSTACGHGTIALATWAIDTGLITPDPGDTEVEVVIDVPSGRVRAIATLTDGRVTSARFRNVPALVHSLDVELPIGGDTVTVDVAYGGAFYASLEASQVGLEVVPERAPELIAVGRAIKRAANAQLDLRLPDDSGDVGLYGAILYDRLGDAHQRNIAVFADGQADRSPCGSGTSARLAVLGERGELVPGDTLVHDSIVGTRFLGRLIGEAPPRGSTRRWETEVQGKASRTGQHTFVLDPDDELGLGFILR